MNESPASDDATLLRRYAEAGDEAAFAELVRCYLGLVSRTARFNITLRIDLRVRDGCFGFQARVAGCRGLSILRTKCVSRFDSEPREVLG